MPSDKFLNLSGVQRLVTFTKQLVATHNVATDAHENRFADLSARIADLADQVHDLASPHQAVEYIDSMLKPNNTQYINTRVMPTGNTRVVLDAQLLANDTGYRMVGEQNTTGSKLRLGTYQGLRYLIRYAGLADYNMDYGSYNPSDRHTFEVGRYFRIDGNQLRDFGAQTFASTSAVYLFAINDATLVDNAPMRVYGCQIYEGTTLVRDYVPARHRFNGDVGLYDRVEGILYTNQGSGAFTPGADVGEPF